MTASLNERPRVFETLEVLRGIAAIIVAERHLSRYFGDYRLPGGYLSVDLFFVLSGFVLAYAYQERLQNGLSWRSFMGLRLIRLYPLYLLAVLIAVAAVLIKSGFDAAEWGNLVSVAALALIFLPASQPAALPLPIGLYPLNYPSWTLPFELLANLLHGFIVPRNRRGVLIGIILLSWLVLVASTLHYGELDIGYELSNFWVGIPRVSFSYFVGVLLFRFWRERYQQLKSSSLLVCVCLLLLYSVPVPPEWRVYYDIMAISVVIPALVLLGACAALRPSARRYLLPLGTASYAFYVLHIPFSELAEGLLSQFGIAIAEYGPWSGVLYFAALFIVVLLLDRYFDHPLRKRLSARFITNSR